MAEEEVKKIEKIDPLAPLNYITEEVLGIPSPITLLRALSPKNVADTIGLPTPAELTNAVIKKVRERVEEKVR